MNIDRKIKILVGIAWAIGAVVHAIITIFPLIWLSVQVMLGMHDAVWWMIGWNLLVLGLMWLWKVANDSHLDVADPEEFLEDWLSVIDADAMLKMRIDAIPLNPMKIYGRTP